MNGFRKKGKSQNVWIKEKVKSKRKQKKIMNGLINMDDTIIIKILYFEIKKYIKNIKFKQLTLFTLI